MSDRELVARAQAGDELAFGQLVEQHRGVVFRAAMAVVGSSVEAEEVAQDAFVAAYRNLCRFRGDSSFRTWLLAITCRKAQDRRRRLGARVRRFFSGDAAGWDSWPSPGASPETLALDGRFSRDLRRLVGGLPERLRAPLLMLASGDHTYEELAAILGRRAGTLKWQVAEARRMLRERLARLGYTDD